MTKKFYDKNIFMPKNFHGLLPPPEELQASTMCKVEEGACSLYDLLTAWSSLYSTCL